ncbi:uncharacterized protein LOC122658155 [Telopea speciosissima]|uniref:uncharacterized protein LOC122658155 n=1 Tax=Telopea speciosissima TaxID=54955 RepID=UPI001CC75F30|nr:uncharacterized protein LOC122658155 [Telopea speciosissima]
MGSACCVAARDKTLPDITDSEALHRNVRYSPSWSFSWENRGRVIGEVDNQINQFSHGSSGNVDVESKDQRDMEMGDVSDGGSPLEDFQTPTWQKFPVNEGTALASGKPFWICPKKLVSCENIAILFFWMEAELLSAICNHLTWETALTATLQHEHIWGDGEKTFGLIFAEVLNLLGVQFDTVLNDHLNMITNVLCMLETDPSVGNDLSAMVKDLRDSSAVADPSVSKLSFCVASTSSSSISKLDPSPSQSQPQPIDSGLSMQANCSPGHLLVRQVSTSQMPGLKSRNNSVSEGRQSFAFSMCSNDTTMGSQGGPSDGWSMRAFSELVASSQRERWSFDSESLGSSRGKLTRSNSRLSMPPSVDMQTCGVCSKHLTERSSWSSQKIIATSELSVVAVLVCGHVFHAECLEHMTPEKDRYDPACPLCMGGEKHVSKMSGKASRMEADLKARSNKISRNRVVDSDLDGDSVVPDEWKGTGRQGKVLKLGPSSSFGKPFLRRHFSLGSNRSKSLSENDSQRRKGFWTRFRKD